MDAHQTFEVVLFAVLMVSWAVWLYAMLAPPRPQVDEPVTRPQEAVETREAPVPEPIAPAARPTVTLRLMCQNERDQHAHVQIPAHARRPTYTHGGQQYVASHKQRNGDWIYRWDRRE